MPQHTGFCMACGAQLAIGHRYCQSCGTQVPDPPQPSTAPAEPFPHRPEVSGSHDHAAATAPRPAVRRRAPLIVMGLTALTIIVAGIGWATLRTEQVSTSDIDSASASAQAAAATNGAPTTLPAPQPTGTPHAVTIVTPPAEATTATKPTSPPSTTEGADAPSTSDPVVISPTPEAVATPDPIPAESFVAEAPSQWCDGASVRAWLQTEDFNAAICGQPNSTRYIGSRRDTGDNIALWACATDDATWVAHNEGYRYEMFVPAVGVGRLQVHDGAGDLIVDQAARTINGVAQFSGTPGPSGQYCQ